MRADINKDYSTDYAIIGDSKLVLKQLLQEIRAQAGAAGRRNDEEMGREVKAVKGEWMNEWMPKLTSEEVPINPYRVIWDLMQAVDRRQTIVTHDSGSPRDQMSVLPGHLPQRVHWMGQVHSVGVRSWSGYGRQAGSPPRSWPSA